MVRKTWAVSIVGAAALFAGGCAGSGERPEVASLPGSQPPTSVSAPGQASGDDQFAKCMKDNDADLGMTQDDPAAGEDQPTTMSATAKGDSAKQKAAFEKCRQFLPDGGNPKPMSPEALENARQFAKCMRDKGVAYPDPDPAAGGGDGVAKLPEGVDPQDPVTRKKLSECTVEIGHGTPGPTK